jgi:hypothetical protein
MKIYTVLLLFILVFVIQSPVASAHSGRTNSSGCHNCYTGSCAGTYHCHNGGYVPPARRTIYVPPTPTPTPLQMTINAEHVLDADTCTYKVFATWDEPAFYNQYSVSAVRTAATTCLDPGPRADTEENQFVFANLQPGSYVINVKPGNAFGWNHYYYCAALDLPAIEPKIHAETITEAGNKYITYTTTCASSIKVDNGIGYLTAKQGKFKVNATGTTDYTLTATSRDGENQELIVHVTDVTPTPTITPTQEVKAAQSTALLQTQGFFSWLFGLFNFR